MHVRAWLVIAGLIGVLAPASNAGAGTGLEGVRSFDHVAVLVLENQNYNTIWGPNSVATYLNGTLKPQAVFADHYYATGHASLSNYIAMVSGQPDQPLTGSDCLAVNLWTCVQGQSLLSGGRNFADQLEDENISWAGYMDGMPGNCFHQPYEPDPTNPDWLGPDPYQGDSNAPPAYNYADRHNPFIYFDDIVGDAARCEEHVRPYTDLSAKLAAWQADSSVSLPGFSFIVPDTCNDGHDAPCANGAPGGLRSADAWMRNNLTPLLDYLSANHGLLIVTFDENGFSDTSFPPGCCSGGLGGVLPGFGGRIGLLAISPDLPDGITVTTPYDHMSLLRTLEDSFGISEHLNNAAQASAMADVMG